MSNSVRIAGLCLAIALATACCIRAIQRGNSAPTSSATQESLDASATKFIKILKNKDVHGLALEFSRKGAYLGVDSTRFAYKGIVKSLNEKGEFYYDFFESRLFDGERDPYRLPSLRDQLIEAKSIKVYANITTEKGEFYGTVTISAIGKPIYGDAGEAFCDVIHTRENGEWKITSVQYL